jgi:hypothetical protein
MGWKQGRFMENKDLVDNRLLRAYPCPFDHNQGERALQEVLHERGTRVVAAEHPDGMLHDVSVRL